MITCPLCNSKLIMEFPIFYCWMCDKNYDVDELDTLLTLSD